MTKYLPLLLALGCASSDQLFHDYAADAGTDYGEAEQAYSIATGTSNKLLGSNSFSAGDECRKNQNTTATCRYLRPPAQSADCGPLGCYNFHTYRLGIQNPEALTASELTAVNAILTKFASTMTTQMSPTIVGSRSFGIMTVVPYAESNLAIAITDLPDPVGLTATYSNFVRFNWSGCGSNLTETPAMPGTWRGCSGATLEIDYKSALAHIQGGSGFAQMVFVHGLLVEMGLGRQTALADRATNPTLSVLAEERYRNGSAMSNGEACHIKSMSNRPRVNAEVTTNEPIDLDFSFSGSLAGCGN